MSKNLIKDSLYKTFITEAKGNENTPGISMSKKIGGENKKINKKGVDDIGKVMKDIEKPLKPDAKSKEMAVNKFNFNGDKEKEYHDQMEIMNGLEMNQYDRTPDETFKKRAKEAIEGSSRMGNNPEWANVVEKGWGGDKDFGKKLVKRIEKSAKKRSEQTDTIKLYGDNWNEVEDTSHKSYAIENKNNKKPLIREFDMNNGEIINYIFFEDLKTIHESIAHMLQMDPQTIDKLISSGHNWVLDHISVAKEDIEQIYHFVELQVSKIGHSDEMDNFHQQPTRSNQEEIPNEFNQDNQSMGSLYESLSIREKKILKDIVGNLEEGVDDSKIQKAAKKIIKYVGAGLTVAVLTQTLSKLNLDNSEKVQLKMEVSRELTGEQKEKFKKIFKAAIDKERMQNLPHPDKITTKEKDEDKSSDDEIKESMKRLKFKKEFNGVNNALKLIPESYRVDMKTFEMTDGNESYKIRWEGNLTEGSAVVLSASDKKVVNEDMEKMKALYSYKSEDTLGLVKGKSRVDENDVFKSMLSKTKKMVEESEEMEGPDDWDNSVKHAPEANKHMVGASTKDNGYQAPKPKEGIWGSEKKPHAPEAKKHMSSASTMENGHKSPKPKEGNWDEIKIKGTTGVKSNTSAPKSTASMGIQKKKQAPEAAKNIQGSTSTDKGTQAPKTKTGDWGKSKKSQAPEAKKYVK